MSMEFTIRDGSSLTRERLSGWLRAMTESAAPATSGDVDAVTWCYQAPNRKYHNENHEIYMMQEDAPDDLLAQLSDGMPPERAKAILAYGGAYHDVAYKHVDGAADVSRAWPEALRERIGAFATYEVTGDEKTGKPVFTTYLTEAGKADATVRMVAEVFGMDKEKGIVHNLGGNEFDSALAAAKYLEGQGVDKKSILAVTAGIAATYPFQPATSVLDTPFKDPMAEQENPHEDVATFKSPSHMDALSDKLKAASGNYGAEMNWAEVNDAMLLSVHLANRDVAPFFSQHFVDVAHGGLQIKVEEIPELRPQAEVDTMQGLLTAAGTHRSAPFLYKSLHDWEFPIQPENIPHFYRLRGEDGETIAGSAYPPLDEYGAAVGRVIRNTELSTHYFEAKKVGVALATALAVLVDAPDVKVKEFVHGQLWEDDAHPGDAHIARLSVDGESVYDALMKGRGKGAVNQLEIDKSPIAGVIFGLAGKEGTQRLYDKVKDWQSVDSKHQAREFVRAVQNEIGKEGMQIIGGQLARVARHPAYGGENMERAAKLENIHLLGQGASIGRA